jgi:hypothetical protein
MEVSFTAFLARFASLSALLSLPTIRISLPDALRLPGPGLSWAGLGWAGLDQAGTCGCCSREQTTANQPPEPALDLSLLLGGMQIVELHHTSAKVLLAGHSSPATVPPERASERASQPARIAVAVQDTRA